jgi:hypothetical protein
MIRPKAETAMRLMFIAAVVAALCSETAWAAAPAKAAAPAEENWIAVCFGEDAQYMQTIGGTGYFHVGNGDRTYDTQKLVQSSFDGNVVCAVPDPKAPRAMSDIALICADRNAKTVSVMYRRDTQTKMVRPSNADPYCRARIDVLH